MSSHKKAYLAQKICPVCQRPFAWRKKWQQYWDEVKYCSERCRRHRSSQSLGAVKADANN
ncbi:DUF2256 domain-containing protein [Vibrio cholerae]|nr:DUF2256 domain-containing protein [Vibrio cholerae]EJL6547239.1 DUF2256 domain-containing protein [Vibrio cholerae]EJX1706638.1 DUF2256 domain-containing protein [Vibrio cholerae]ELB8601914.1 DUF2256 domain-containing protein [Vibrio cholerae]HDZ9232449.1 DUF2256 domain-containing protein [Vibrio cholerae]